VQGPASQDAGFNGSTVCGGSSIDAYYPAGQTLYTWSSGTSHSTPAAAGAAALAYEYYGRVLAPDETPSPAMLKALLLNSPRMLDGVGTDATVPGAAQGWGGASLHGLVHDGPYVVLDQEIVFAESGESVELETQVVDPTAPLHVSLVWTDAPGSTVGAAYVNDLDLEVIHDDTTYRGNVFAGAVSTSGGAADPANNVERVVLPAGTSGAFTVRVLARNISGDGLPGNADLTDQDFALVVSNAEQIEPVIVVTIDSYSYQEVDGNGDDSIDPGETLSLSITLRNSGDTALTDVRGTLAITGGDGIIIHERANFADIPPGATATNTTLYVLYVAESQPCGDPLDLQLQVTTSASSELLVPAAISVETGVFDVYLGSVVCSGANEELPYHVYLPALVP
jgi:hypothetical protein